MYRKNYEKLKIFFIYNGYLPKIQKYFYTAIHCVYGTLQKFHNKFWLFGYNYVVGAR